MYPKVSNLKTCEMILQFWHLTRIYHINNNNYREAVAAAANSNKKIKYDTSEDKINTHARARASLS